MVPTSSTEIEGICVHVRVRACVCVCVCREREGRPIIYVLDLFNPDVAVFCGTSLWLPPSIAVAPSSFCLQRW